jgi:hypothetical protein
MNSESKTPHGVVPGSRHGNGRAERRNHRPTANIAARSRSRSLDRVVILVRFDVRVGVAGVILALRFFCDLNVALARLGQ